MSKYLKKCCKGSFGKPSNRIPQTVGKCPVCKRWVGMINRTQLASHYPVKPK